ncbi:MAG: hypothetical protein ACRDPW_02330 [Mycobacteriales bacterium]
MPRTEPELAAIASRTQRWIDTVDPAELTPVAPQILRLREAVAARHTSEQEIEAAVRGARNAGFSWARIALVLGVSRQSAHERFAEKISL